MNTRLDQRINKVEHWTSEIDEQLTQLNNEIDALLEYKVSTAGFLAVLVFENISISETYSNRTYSLYDIDLNKSLEFYLFFISAYQ